MNPLITLFFLITALFVIFDSSTHSLSPENNEPQPAKPLALEDIFYFCDGKWKIRFF